MTLLGESKKTVATHLHTKRFDHGEKRFVSPPVGVLRGARHVKIEIGGLCLKPYGQDT